MATSLALFSLWPHWVQLAGSHIDLVLTHTQPPLNSFSTGTRHHLDQGSDVYFPIRFKKLHIRLVLFFKSQSLSQSLHRSLDLSVRRTAKKKCNFTNRVASARFSNSTRLTVDILAPGLDSNMTPFWLCRDLVSKLLKLGLNLSAHCLHFCFGNVQFYIKYKVYVMYN